MEKTVRTLIAFFFFPIKTFFRWIINHCPNTRDTYFFTYMVSDY